MGHPIPQPCPPMLVRDGFASPGHQSPVSRLPGRGPAGRRIMRRPLLPPLALPTISTKSATGRSPSEQAGRGSVVRPWTARKCRPAPECARYSPDGPAAAIPDSQGTVCHERVVHRHSQAQRRAPWPSAVQGAGQFASRALPCRRGPRGVDQGWRDSRLTPGQGRNSAPPRAPAGRPATIRGWAGC